MSQKVPRLFVRCKLSEVVARARTVAQEQAARRAETACLLCLALLLLLAACSPPAPTTPPPPVPGHHLNSDWYEVDSTTE